MRRTPTAIIVVTLGILMASAAHAATPAQSSAADEAAVRAEIARGYDAYGTHAGDESFKLSPDFQRVWNRALAGGDLSFDPFCGCQEFTREKFRHRIVSLSVNGSRAVADVDVDIGVPTDPGVSPWGRHRLTFARTPEGWRLDDIGDVSYPSLKTAMKADEPGSWAGP